MKTLQELKSNIRWASLDDETKELIAVLESEIESEIERLKAQQMSEDFITVEEFRQQQRRDLFTQVALRTVHLSTTEGEYYWDPHAAARMTEEILAEAEEFKKKQR